MAGSAHPGDKLNVFISYSRADLAFADQLYAALGAFNFELSVDRHSIPGGDEWEKRLGALIRDTGTVVFVLSPSSAVSKFCRWEVEEAGRLNKRILPVLCRPLDGVSPPPQLASRNYIYLYAEPELPGSGFGVGLAELVKALNTDLDWLREHTDYLRQANNWDEGSRPANRLLSGGDIDEAKAWVARRPKNAPEPTPLQLDFIKASEAEEARRQNAEVERLREVAEIERKAKEALQLQLDRANRALADAINNDLVFGGGGRWAPRTCNALWRLAVADEAVKGEYVAILAGSSGEMARAAPGFAQISRALGLLRPSPDEAERLVAAAISAQSTSKGFRRDEFVAAEIGALAPKLTDPQAGQALNKVLNEIGKTTDHFALRALAEAIRALPLKLTDAQASQALEPVLKQIDQTTNANAVQALAEAIQALPLKLTDAQASKAVNPVLKKIGETYDPDALRTLAQAINALPVKLTDTQAGPALDKVLNEIGETRNEFALHALAQAIKALAPKLTTEQASQALDKILDRFGKTDNAYALRALARVIQALAPWLTDAQADEALDLVLKQIGQTTNPNALPALAETIQALAPKLTSARAGEALDPVLKQIGRTTNVGTLQAFAEVIQALAPKLTGTQASQALTPILQRFRKTDSPHALAAFARVIQALPVKLADAQAGRALFRVLDKIRQTTDAFDVLGPLAQAIWALSAKFTEAQARRALFRVLDEIGQTTDPSAPLALAQAIPTLAAKLTDAQARQALDPILTRIGGIDFGYALEALAQAFQTLAPKLTPEQAHKASDRAKTLLAWAASDKEAAEWARALVTLLDRAGDPDKTNKLVAMMMSPRSSLANSRQPTGRSCEPAQYRAGGRSDRSHRQRDRRRVMGPYRCNLFLSRRIRRG